jgi:hypothetical protein
MDKQNSHLLLRVTSPDKQSLSFCDANPHDLKNWVDALPKANIGETARQLYQALVELNQLLTPSENRLPLLEILRPEVYFVCKQLEKHFLNQAIVLDERPRKVANLCQALQNHLAIGYKLIVTSQAAQPNRQRNQLMALALQRATHSLCGTLIRANQLYCPAPEGLWLELHQLYQIARAGDLHKVLVRDPQALHTQSLSTEQSYLVALLLGCARCNQMRQSAIARLAEALEPWSTLATLQAGNDASSLFAIAPQVDGPPRYISLFQQNQLHHELGIDPSQLVDAIKEHVLLPTESIAQSRLTVPEGFSHDMLQHLAAAWGDIAERTFQRSEGKGTLKLCIGMSSLHYHLAGKRPFKLVLQAPVITNAPSLNADTGAPDVWSKAFDAEKINQWDNGLPFEEIKYSEPAKQPSTVETNTPESYPSHEVAIVNISPGGYCLSWPKEVPSQLQAGELLGVQGLPQQGWSIAVVRWVRQVRGGGTQMGIELIAPHAQACGLQLVRKTEQNSQYLRALLLPEISAISRPACLITARLPFQEGNKVSINLDGNEHRAVLSRRQTSTGSFNQFEYRSIGHVASDQRKPVRAAESRTPGGEEDFDSLWKSL